MICLYKGARGRGKTLTMVKDGLQFFLEGYRVIANFKVKYAEYISNEEVLSLDKDSNIFNAVLLLDELAIFFDSRRGMRKANIDFSAYLMQTRKRGIHILCSTQFANQIDLRIRQHLNIIAFPNFIKSKLVCEVTYMDLTRLEDNVTLLDNAEIKPLTQKVVFNAEPIFKLYNTNEMIA